MRAFPIAFAALLISACTTSAEDGDRTAATSDDQPAGAAGVSVERISETAREGIEDQFISCIEDKGNGIKLSQFYLIKDGVVKSYSQMQNYARPMCDAGQEGCALGWQGEKIGLYFKTASGAVNQMLLDLDTLTMEKQLTSSRGVDKSTSQCTTGPLPDGVKID